MNLLVEKRSGEIVPFNKDKIQLAIVKAAISSGQPQQENIYDKIVLDIYQEIENRFVEFYPNVENIHDIIEKHLMKNGLYEIAKSYILYRAEKQKHKEEERKKSTFLKKLTVIKNDGRKVVFSPRKIKNFLSAIAQGLEDVSLEKVYDETIKNIHDGIKTEDIYKSIILAVTSLIEIEPEYNILSSRLFLCKLRREVFGKSAKADDVDELYRQAFVNSIKIGVHNNILDKRMLDFDLEKLASSLVLDRDNLFKYIGLQTLYERYFTRFEDKKLEMPQIFWMRVAMGLSLLEENKEERAIEFYNAISQMHITPSTPTLFHAGLVWCQLSSCYLNYVDDDLKHIFKVFGDNAQLSKFSGGIGTSWGAVRSTGALIRTTNVDSQGVIPFLKIANDVTVAINRSGKRRGATCVYLPTWHLDIEDFLDLKKNTGDERRRTHDMNTANWIPDLFMERVKNNGKWTLFSPDETPDLHELYGQKFKDAYLAYEKKAEKGKLKKFKVVEASKLWKKMITSLFETGHPWMCWSDPSNIRSPQDHTGVVHSSNLCCIAGDQRVVTDLGILTVKELYDLGKEVKVVGLNRIEKASKMLLPRPNAPMVKICTKEGYSHKVTPDHKVWVLDFGYKEAKDLEFGDKIAIQQFEGMWGTKHMPKEAFICGIIASDGTFGENTVHIDVWQKDAFIIPKIEQYVCELIKEYENKIDYDHASYESPKFATCDEGKKFRLTSSRLYQILNYLGFNKDTKLVVPSFIWVSDKETVASYLETFYLGDGTTEAGEITTSNICNTNKKLLEDIQIILANFGCKTSLTLMDEEGWKELPDGKGGKRLYYCNAKYRLMVTSIRGNKIIEETTKIGTHRNNEVFLDNLQKEGYKQKLYCTFEMLEKCENEDAYCLTVQNEDHLWTVNGIITKNTEIILNTSVEETAVCNLLSLNYERLTTNKGFNEKVAATVIKTGVRMLDNVIDLNFYPTIEAETSNKKHRPIGFGIMGVQDAMFKLGISFESLEAEEFTDATMEFISYHVIMASADLAKERGRYESYNGSKWDRGIFPLDALDLLEQERGAKIDVNRKCRQDWNTLRDYVKTHGMRNSNLMAIAPTASISTIVGSWPSFEAQFSNIYVKSNMSGEFTIVNEYLVKELKKLKLWNVDMLNKMKYYDGDISKIEEIPNALKQKYKGIFDIDQLTLIHLAALRSKWIDQSQSLNLFVRGKSGQLLSDLYFYAWGKGLKTTYYLRTLGASQIEKSTLDASYGLTQNRNFETNGHHSNGNGEIKLCKINDPTCESCQ